MDIRDLHSKVYELESTEGVYSAQVDTSFLHKRWLDEKSVDVTVQRNRSNLFSSDRTRKEKLENSKRLQVDKAHEALKKYREQGEPRKGDHQAT